MKTACFSRKKMTRRRGKADPYHRRPLFSCFSFLSLFLLLPLLFSPPALAEKAGQEGGSLPERRSFYNTIGLRTHSLARLEVKAGEGEVEASIPDLYSQNGFSLHSCRKGDKTYFEVRVSDLNKAVSLAMKEGKKGGLSFSLSLKRRAAYGISRGKKCLQSAEERQDYPVYYSFLSPSQPPYRLLAEEGGKDKPVWYLEGAKDKEGKTTYLLSPTLPFTKGCFRPKLSLPASPGKACRIIAMERKTTYLSSPILVQPPKTPLPKLSLPEAGQLKTPKILFNGREEEGGAYSGRLRIGLQFSAKSFDHYQLSIQRIGVAGRAFPIEPKLLFPSISCQAGGGEGVSRPLEEAGMDDGLYQIRLAVFDKAGRKAEKTAHFSYNRLGSLYVPKGCLSDIGGEEVYLKQLDQDLQLTEYNPSRLDRKSLKIAVSRDGQPLDGLAVKKDYKEPPQAWASCAYCLAKEDFTQDGYYKICLSSRDRAGNFSEFSAKTGRQLAFHIDSKPPEIQSIEGVEQPYVYGGLADVRFTVYDRGGLASIRVYDRDAVILEEQPLLLGDEHYYEGRFSLPEEGTAHRLRIVAVDRAGNIQDTDSDDFHPPYAFSREIRVTKGFNFLLTGSRPLFLLAVGAVFALIFFFVWRRQQGEKKPVGTKNDRLGVVRRIFHQTGPS